MQWNRVPNRHTYSSVANSLSFAREAARSLRGKQYDVIHSHERGYRQDVLTIHTFSYRSGLERYSFLRKLDQVCLSPRSWIYLWLEKRQMASPRLVAVSDVIRADIQRHYGRTEGVSVITPGVDLDRFHPDRIVEHRQKHPAHPAAVPGDLTILFVGGEFKRKGLDRLIPAIGDRMRLIVVGRGERLEHYRRLAVDCGVGDRVEFVGHVEGDVLKYYAAADVVALPSASEAFGMSVLEAMACGLPVVASRAAGVAGLVEEGRNGFLAGDVPELASAFMRLRDAALRKAMGANARLTAERNSWDRAADAYEAVFTDVIRSRDGKGHPS